MDMINKVPERHEIEALLPWYVAGTLSRRDAYRVEQALAGDSELARLYDLVREELAATILLNEALGAPSACAAEKLVAAIDAEETRAPRRRLQRLSPTPPSVTAGGDPTFVRAGGSARRGNPDIEPTLPARAAR